MIHRDERFWPEAEKFFSQERWGRNSRLKFSYFPFGAGAHLHRRRFCLGEGVIMLAVMARRWRFEAVPGHPSP